jgi:hypothetical protein
VGDESGDGSACAGLGWKPDWKPDTARAPGGVRGAGDGDRFVSSISAPQSHRTKAPVAREVSMNL